MWSYAQQTPDSQSPMSPKTPTPPPPFQKTVFRLAGDKYGGFVSVYLAWKSAVGSLLAEKSHPIKYEQNTVYVAVENNTWLQELVLLKAKILKDLAKTTGLDIKDMYYMIRTKK